MQDRDNKMAGDWIKMRGSLLTNPKVIRMARFLAEDSHFQEWWTRGTNKACDTTVYELCDVTVVTRVTVGSLLAVWSAANECANKDGFIRGVTLFEVDEMAGVPSFGRALELVGWCIESDDGVQFPNFDEHNTVGKQRSSSAKTGAERTKEWRERKKSADISCGDDGDVTVTSHGDHREEKRREEKEHMPAKPAAALRAGDLVTLGVPEQVAVDFLAVRKAKRAPLTRTALDSIQREAEKAKVSLGDALAVCAARGWQSLKADWLTNNPAPVQPAPADPVSPYRRFQS